MGNRHSLNINIKAAEPAPETAAPAAKEVVGNGATEAIPAIDQEANGECAVTEAPESPKPEGDAQEPKSAQKQKKNPIDWIQKKISFKKLKTPKKAPPPATTEEVMQQQPETDAANVPETIPEAPEQEKVEERPTTPAGIEVQSEPVEKVDQATGHSDPAPPPSEPIVEVTPTTNGFREQEGQEHFVEHVEEVTAIEESTKEDQPTEEASPEESNTDLGLAEKLANLGLEAATEILAENGITVTNGDGDHPEEN